MTFRPDEIAAQSEIERAQSRNKILKTAGKTALGIGTTALSLGIASRISPFLSEFISPEVALKGINKVSPKLGSFLKNGMNKGLALEEGLNFIKDKISAFEAPEESKKSSDLSEHPIEKNDPALHQFLVSEIGKGRKPQEALAIAKVQGFDKNIQTLSKKLGKDLFNIIDQIYGGAQPQVNAPMQQPPQSPMQQQAQVPTQPQQGGQGQQALMAILEKIRQSRGG